MNILEKTKLKMLGNPDMLFYAILAAQLNCEFSEEVPTAATNGKRIWFNPGFVAGLTDAQLLGLYVHELLHVVYCHMFRKEDREHALWNSACDYVINQEILEGLQLELPEGGLYDPMFSGMSAEQVYEKLLQNAEQSPPPPWGDLEASDEENPSMQQEVETILVNAAMATNAMTAGRLPAAIQLFLDSRVKPKVPWYKVLRRYLQPLRQRRYSMVRPNERFAPEYMPSLSPENKKLEISVAWDMSGSVSDTDSVRYISETLGITKTMKASLTVIQFDTRIQHVNQVAKPADFKKLDYHGRGGTDLDCLMEFISQNPTDALVVFTDGYFHMPSKPACPVIWIIVGNPSFHAPYGKIIHLES